MLITKMCTNFFFIRHSTMFIHGSITSVPLHACYKIGCAIKTRFTPRQVGHPIPISNDTVIRNTSYVGHI